MRVRAWLTFGIGLFYMILAIPMVHQSALISAIMIVFGFFTMMVGFCWLGEVYDL